MHSLVFLGVSSFLLSLFLTPLCRNLFRRWGFMDQPDGRRKLHLQAVPRIGGVPIAIAYLGAFGTLLLTPSQGGHIVQSGLGFAWKLLPAAGVVFLVGLADDLVGLKPWQKLTGQLLAAGLAIYAGIQVSGFGGHLIGGWVSVVATIVWLVGCTNAVNLIDGVDGLAAGVGFFAATTTLLAALINNNFALALATIPLAAALLGFLRYNFNPATIFLGDSGSLLIGFLLGCYGILWSQKSATMLGMTAPLMALTIPLLDTAIAIIRRFLRQQPIFGADQGHIHHRLLARGLTPRRVVLTLYGICGLAAGLSLLQNAMQERFGGVIIVVFCAATWMGIQHLGYVEFRTVGRMAMAGAFRRLLNAQLTLNQFQEKLAASESPETSWDAIRDYYRDFGFTGVRLQVDGEEFSDGAHDSGCWTLQLPIDKTGSITFWRPVEAPGQVTVIAPFIDAIATALRQKTAARQAQAVSV